MPKILKSGDRVCLFCGESEEKFYDEYTPYWECNCKDAIRDRQLVEEIKKLEKMRPKKNFEILKEDVLHRRKEE